MQCTGQSLDNKGIWVHGQSGIGKSSWVRDYYAPQYTKIGGQWWDGYQGEKIVLFEDIGHKHKNLAYDLKLWLDRYHTPAETKGGMVVLTHDKLIMTS